MNILISRTDGIGDVILTLPMVGVLKKKFPEAKIFFLGNNYTKEIIISCSNVDEFLNWDDVKEKYISSKYNVFSELNIDTIIHVFPNKQVAVLAKKAKIPKRIGTRNRLFHWFTCNKLVKLSRKNSDLHEAQLNIKLINKIILDKTIYSTNELSDYYNLNRISKLDSNLEKFIDNKRFNLIIHPKSKGSSREWELNNYYEIIKQLPENKFNIIITGTESEGQKIRDVLCKNNKVTDLTGKLTLKEFISLINCIDGIVACSTGPLHIAAALGKYALGIYPPMRPLHPGRWAPIGKKAIVFVKKESCNKCKKLNYCECINQIEPRLIIDKIIEISENKIII